MTRTDPYVAALERVAEAARALIRHPGNFGKPMHGIGILQMEVRALDALPPPPAPLPSPKIAANVETPNV